MSSIHGLFISWFYFIFLYNHTNKIHSVPQCKYSNKIYTASCWLWILVRPFILPIAPLRNYKLWTRDLFRAFLAFPIIICSWITSILRQWKSSVTNSSCRYCTIFWNTQWTFSPRLCSFQRLFFLCPTFSSFYHTELKALLLIYLLVRTPKKVSIMTCNHRCNILLKLVGIILECVKKTDQGREWFKNTYTQQEKLILTEKVGAWLTYILNSESEKKTRSFLKTVYNIWLFFLFLKENKATVTLLF